jgi:hypothetical protein
LALKANAWAYVASQRIGLKRPRRDETITWKPATGVGIAAAIRGDPKRQKPKTPSTKGTGLDVKPPAGLQRGEGKSFFLDILFYRMSVIAVFVSYAGSAYNMGMSKAQGRGEPYGHEDTGGWSGCFYA